jgi:hypothetical protein
MEREQIERIVGQLYLVIKDQQARIADLEACLPKEATPKPPTMTLVSTSEGSA